MFVGGGSTGAAMSLERVATTRSPGRSRTECRRQLADRVPLYVPRILQQHLADDPDERCWIGDGTAVFVDISGFTKLSERLARSGREGAEHLVDTISACFSTLLSEAYSRGGSLLKFGGDALLLWFEGDEHPLRACAAAVAMRRTLRRDRPRSAPARATSCCACPWACTADSYQCSSSADRIAST